MGGERAGISPLEAVRNFLEHDAQHRVDLPNGQPCSVEGQPPCFCGCDLERRNATLVSLEDLIYMAVNPV